MRISPAFTALEFSSHQDFPAVKKWTVAVTLEFRQQGKPENLMGQPGTPQGSTTRTGGEKWPCIHRASATSQYKILCTICQCTESCQHQGEKDVRRHIERKKHCDNVKDLESQPQIGCFLGLSLTLFTTR